MMRREGYNNSGTVGVTADSAFTPTVIVVIVCSDCYCNCSSIVLNIFYA